MSQPNGTKKDLQYSSFEEFMKLSNFDFSSLDFNKPTICNSLLKIYDEGNRYLNNGDDEKAFLLLLRFFEGFLKLKNSKLYKDDKSYVEKFISMQTVKKAMTVLEKLKPDIKKRYEERDAKQQAQVVVTKETNTNELNKISSELNKVSIEEEIDKNFINPKELADIVKKSIYKILIIDIRSKSEFDFSHMDLSILLSDESKKKQLISYINIPEDLVENVSWNICESLKKFDAYVARIFASRADFEYLILFDKDSTSLSVKTDSKISILKRALYEYDLEKVKNEPIILDGGWSQWLIFYPAFKKSSNQTDLFKNGILIQDEMNKQTNKKTFDFDYPELFDSKPQPQPPQPITPAVQVQNIEPIKEEETTDNIAIKKEEPPITSIILKPIIDRTNKPMSNTVPENNPPKKEEIIEIPIENKPTEISRPVAPIPSRLEKPKQDEKYEEKEIKYNFPKPPPQFANTPIPPQASTDTTNLNQVIFNSVYAPSRFNKPIHTPYMKDGAAKYLNSETGLFSYHPSINRPELDVKPKVVQIPPKQTQFQVKPIEPPSSGLKRTLSSPNIANLDDEILQVEESTLKTITKKPTPNSIAKPLINRNSKPMPEHVMRSRIEELQPAFGKTHPGLTGIRNLGNTCFMNSILQCLSNTEKLVKFFLSGQFKQDLNRKNDLGFRGEIADEFSVIVHSIWGGHCRIISPKRFKLILGEFNPQFVTNEQQDAQELLLCLLDGLHEDLNRVQNRPKSSEKDDDNENKSDYDAANIAWNIHLSINNSIIVDLFQVGFIF